MTVPERPDRGQRGLGGSCSPSAWRESVRPDRGRPGRPAPGPHDALVRGARPGATVANHVTARLDVAMLPAFVSAASVGLYSVATSVSLIVYQLVDLRGLVDPRGRPGTPTAAASEGRRLALGLAGDRGRGCAVVLALLARAPARPRLRRRLPRTPRSRCCCSCPAQCCSPGSSILGAGIYAAGRPFTATATQIARDGRDRRRPVRVPAERWHHRRCAGVDGLVRDRVLQPR